MTLTSATTANWFFESMKPLDITLTIFWTWDWLVPCVFWKLSCSFYFKTCGFNISSQKKKEMSDPGGENVKQWSEFLNAFDTFRKFSSTSQSCLRVWTFFHNSLLLKLTIPLKINIVKSSRMDCPPKSDIDTIFNRLRSQPYNKVIWKLH